MKLKLILDQFIQWLIAVLMGLMVINVTWQVFSRYVLGDPSSFTDELSRYMMVWLGLAGAAYVSGKNGHLAIDILPEKLKGNQLLYLQLFIHGMVVFFGAVIMIWGGGNLVYITQILQQKSATLQIPLSWIYGIVPISGVLVVYYHLFHIVQLLKNKE
ncbi:TRAP-type C4-dicarboxylate transport system permease small subunit [Algoriphagus boseongensis]|uniref:TRAP-type C4-dicarboxylate transport system permease small subunit n=1 Tax=Algoriphagus boseongensis TaxID=1442587 RepID=A0A4R6TAJ6_9BACT|nr:TRAP transporter small permease [Algoriphagus boseongensis]TDQ19219.1 TRAP-type C4-dicarboxylate transport system permease small subunit [Algoriphagus boseongensis]